MGHMEGSDPVLGLDGVGFRQVTAEGTKYRQCNVIRISVGSEGYIRGIE